MTLLRPTLASVLALSVISVAASGCGLIDKLKGKGADAGVDPNAAPVDAAVAVEIPDAAPVADAAVALAPTATPAIVGACKPGDVADCTNKCQVLKNQSSCVNLGIMFQNGDGVAKDPNKATTLFQGACNAGIGAGCDRFGLALKNGSGIVADAPRAKETFKKGCDQRNPDSCNQFALMNVRGEGGAKDTVTAVSFFQKSCDLGDAFGCGNLANHLASGDGIARDPARAAQLRTTACNKGDQQACSALASSGGADAGAPSTTTGTNPTAADCVALRKIFMDTCQNTCAQKLKEKNIKKTDAERLLFCEGGCSSQMASSPAMAKCKGK